VWSIYKDINNILWVGTYKGGLNRIDLNSNTFTSISNSQKQTFSISSNHIRVIKEDSYNNLWVGTYDGGLNIINKNNFRSSVYKIQPC
jgi:ligand-binding sensor domain-containing protein